MYLDLDNCRNPHRVILKSKEPQISKRFCPSEDRASMWPIEEPLALIVPVI